MQTLRQSMQCAHSGTVGDTAGDGGDGVQAPPRRARVRARALPPRPHPLDPPPTTPWRCAPSFTRNPRVPLMKPHF